MEWATLQYSKGKVDWAGNLLASGAGSITENDEALEVLSNWRAAHAFPLNTIQIGLRKKARKVYEHAAVAQRLKRVPSIILKIQRFPTMNLSRMQDIGGCRAVVETVGQVRRLRSAYARSKQQPKLVGEKDYIVSPKESGYRGIHLIYRFQSEMTPEHNGRLIELQLRSRFQHAWATAVETVGTFLQQSLKSSQGSDKWLEFFTLTGSAFAVMEKTPLVPHTPKSEQALRREIKQLASALEVTKTLTAYGQAVQVSAGKVLKNAYYFLLSFVPEHLTVYSFRRDQLEMATERYLEIEKSQSVIAGAQAVLVSSESLAALRRAYPNYFMDTQIFMQTLSRFMDGA